MASVVLPRPGGPKKSMWSSDSPRPRAASIAIWSDVFTCSWPTNSSSRDGTERRFGAGLFGERVGGGDLEAGHRAVNGKR